MRVPCRNDEQLDKNDSQIKITQRDYRRTMMRTKQKLADNNSYRGSMDHLRCTTGAENGGVIIGLDEARTHAWMTTAKR